MRLLARLSWVELKLFVREPLTVLFALALPLIVLVILGGVFGNQPDATVYRGVGPMTYYVPAYLGLVIASIAVISIPTHLAGNRERGVLKRFHASAVPAWVIAGAEVAVTLVLAVASGMLLVVAATLVYDFDRPASLPGVVGAFLLSTVAFAAFGVLLGAVLPTARAAQALGILLWFVMLMLGGAGPPVEVLGAGMQRITYATPLWHVIQIIQEPWLGLDAGGSWLVVVGLLVASSAVAVRRFRFE